MTESERTKNLQLFWLNLLPTVIGGLYLPLALAFAVLQRPMQRAVDRYLKKLSVSVQVDPEAHQ
jgi:hypothetical protein